MAGEDKKFLGPKRRKRDGQSLVLGELRRQEIIIGFKGLGKPLRFQFGSLKAVFQGKRSCLSQQFREFFGGGKGREMMEYSSQFEKEIGSWEREQRDPRRKVPRPSVGICLNSWGNPPIHPPLPVFLRGQGRECVCVNVGVRMCWGEGVLHCNGVLGGRVGAERRGGG